MKRFKGFNPMLFAAAVIFLCVTVYSLVSNVTVYVRQRDWPVTTATVIDVAENGKEYNITYQYEARGNVYTGKLHRVRLRYGFGETLTVRYDPDAPEKSVRQGAMTRRSILTQAGLSVVFCLVGYCLIRRALPQKEPEESAPERPVPKTPARKSRPAEGTVSAAEVRQAEDRVFREVCQLVRDVQEKHPSVGYAVRLERSALLEAEGYAPARYEAWLVVSLGRNRTILESGPDTGEWPDARDRITRIRGGKLTVSDGYGRLSRELEAITADYEAGPDAYAENKAASDEMLREACRVEWSGYAAEQKNSRRGAPAPGVDIFLLSAFAVDFRAALGAGDDDAALAPGYPAHRAAVGAGEILVLLVPAAGQGLPQGIDHLVHISRILCPALGQVLGKHAKHHPNGQHHGHRRQNAVGHLVPDKEVDHVQNNGRPEGHEPQLVHAVAPIHEPGQGVANFLEEIHTSASFCKKMRSFRKRTHSFYRNLPQT